MKINRVRPGLLMSVVIVITIMAYSPTTGLAVARDATAILYVKPEMSGDCSSWLEACRLETALAQAAEGSEIWVAGSTYYPDTNGHVNPREATFQLKSHVAVYGGFAGDETNRDQRNVAAHPTTLSGDIGVQGNVDDNCYHVVTGSGTDASAVLDGFNIAGGNANAGSDPNDKGGGMVIVLGSPSLNNVSFSGNHAAMGGGIYNYSSNPHLTSVTFSVNSAGVGGGMANESSNPVLTNVAFSSNSGNSTGGMYNYSSSPILTNVTFTSNTANYGGGMLNVFTSSPVLVNVTFSANSAVNSGGGIFNSSSSNPVLTDVTFSSNTAGISGGGMYNNSVSPNLTRVAFSANTAKDGGGMYNHLGIPVLDTVTFSNNSSEYGGGIYNNISHTTLNNITFSNNTASIKGGGLYNISSYPYLTNVTFSGNTSGDGGGMFNNFSNPTLTNVTFSGNSANSGGGLYNEASTPTLINSIVWGNTPANLQITGIATISYSAIQGGWEGEGNIGAEPGLDLSLGPLADNGGFTLTHTLLTGSPAIDAGSPVTCPSPDQRGALRPVDGNLDGNPRCDMGTVEYQPMKVFLPLIIRCKDGR